MEGYSAKVKSHMLRFYRSLNERDRRRYAAVEAGQKAFVQGGEIKGTAPELAQYEVEV